MRFDFLAPEPARIRRTPDSSGLHFTPPALSRTLVEESLRYLDIQTNDQITVFAVSEEGELVQMRGSGSDAWRARNLTRETVTDGGLHRIRVEIAVSAGPGNTLHVFGVSPSRGLIHYWCPPTLAWRAQDLTHGRVDIDAGAEIRGRPSAMQGSGDELLVGASGENGIVLYRWTPTSDWSGDPLPVPKSLTGQSSSAWAACGSPSNACW